ncbi:hypothetical protein V2J09_011018 [Rumex salicifolius]
MDVLVVQVQVLSGNSQDIPHLHSVLKQSEDLLRTQSSVLASFLGQLDPSSHSLGYLYLLEAFTTNPYSKEQAHELVLLISNFISSCRAEQIRLAPEKLKDQVMLLEAPIRGVGAMLMAAKKLQPSSEHLTTLHQEFLALCISAKCYKYGSRLLEDHIFEVDQPRDLFLYCYYGGMICIGLKQFQKAWELLRSVVTSPMSSLNAIAVEAYKKYILVSLILHGQFPTSFPKYTSSVAQRSLKNFTQLYLDLASTYSSGNIIELETFVNANQEKFNADNNLGLVKQVVSSTFKRNIQRLTQTYLTLSLQDIASTVRLSCAKDAEMHVLKMIQDGEIYATINQKDGMVRFLEDPEQYKTCEMIEQIDSSIQRIITLSKKLTAIDESMSCDPSYLAKVGRERQRFDFDDLDSVPQKFNI